MKRIILILLLSLAYNFGHAQEWFTSFDVAKRLALVQNKMLFVVWEESFNGSIPLVVKTEDGNMVIVDLAKDNSLDPIIRDYFVPVRLQESNYQDFMKSAEGRSYSYINKLTDNSIKIMDVNGNIINVDMTPEVITNFSDLIANYALNTAYLNTELRNYTNEKSYLTSYLLAEKYIEYSIYAKKDLRFEINDLAKLYLSEAEMLASKPETENRSAIIQKIELTRIEQSLILGRHKKAYRQLKRMEAEDIDQINERLYGFLHYTIGRLRKDDSKIELWKPKISSFDLKKAEMILNINKHGNYN